MVSGCCCYYQLCQEGYVLLGAFLSFCLFVIILLIQIQLSASLVQLWVVPPSEYN